MDVALGLVEVEQELRGQPEEFYILYEREGCLESYREILSIKEAIKKLLSHTCLIFGLDVQPYS